MKPPKTTSRESFPDLINRPGVFMQIPTGSLRIDTQYQRPVSGPRVDKIASDWSWIACGCLTVALRGSGSGDYFVVDGQHRLEGAIRAEIPELPCIVFESVSHSGEAQNFIDLNTSRKAITVVDRYRAILVVEDPIALHVQKLLEIADRVPVSSRSSFPSSKAKVVMCIDYLLRAATTSPDILDHIWPLMINLCENELITRRLLQGFIYIERYLTNTSVMERHWRRRVLSIGYSAIVKSIDETIGYEGASNTAVCARGILRAVNQGLRKKLTLVTTNEESHDD